MANRKPFASTPMVPRIHGKLTPDEVAATISENCLVEPCHHAAKGSAYVFFVPHAWDSFVSSVHFGKWVPENELESQYFLEGYSFVDKRGVSSTVVTNIVTPNSASQGKTSAQLYSEENNAYTAVKAKEAELTKYAAKGKDNRTGAQINPFYERFGAPIRVGFGHTHPNIGCFFSTVDKTSIFAVPGEPWITMVADPRREELLVAVGSDMRVAEVVTFKAKKKSATKNSHTPAANEVVEAFSQFVQFVNAQLDAGCTAKINIGGKLPGTLTFNGKITLPKRRKKTRERSSAK